MTAVFRVARLLAIVCLMSCGQNDPREQLQSDDRFARLEAIERIAAWKDRDGAVRALRPVLLGDRDQWVRISVGRALSRLATPEAIDLVFERGTAPDEVDGVRFALLAALGATKDPAIVPRLIDLLRAGPHHRAENFGADQALRQLGRPAADAALAALADPCLPGTECVPFSAKSNLLAIIEVNGDASFRDRLSPYLADPDLTFRRLVAGTMQSLEARPASPR